MFDPVVREKQRLACIERNKNPEYIEKLQRAAKENWENGVYNNDEYHINVSNGIKVAWERRGFRERMSIAFSKAFRGKKKSKKHRENISKALKGRDFSEEHRHNISLSHIGLLGKDNNPNWRGGISRLPYPFDFNEELKRRVLERDCYTCQLCHTKTDLMVHHIDYDKENLDLNNLVTLCRTCNPRVNFKRDYWTSYFKKRMAMVPLKAVANIGWRRLNPFSSRYRLPVAIQ